MTDQGTTRTYREDVYDRYASVYKSDWLSPDPHADNIWARAALHRLRGWLPKESHAKCLDLGCGAGQVLHALRSAGYADVIGVDASAECVAITQNKGFTVFHADLRDYLLQCSDSFDLICAFDLIEHFGKHEILDVLRLIWKTLKPHGCFILQTPNALSPWASHYRYGDLTHELIFSPACLKSTLRLTGFVDLEIREVGPYFHGPKSAARWCLWKMIWALCAVWNLAEIGSLNGGVYTRNMLVRGLKDAAPEW